MHTENGNKIEINEVNTCCLKFNQIYIENSFEWVLEQPKFYFRKYTISISILDMKQSYTVDYYHCMVSHVRHIKHKFIVAHFIFWILFRGTSPTLCTFLRFMTSFDMSPHRRVFFFFFCLEKFHLNRFAARYPCNVQPQINRIIDCASVQHSHGLQFPLTLG